MRNWRRYASFLLVGLFLAISACATNNRTVKSLDRAIQDGNWQQASALYNQNERFFRANFTIYENQLSLIATELNQEFNSKLKSTNKRIKSISWPTPVIDWPYTADHIIEAEDLLISYEFHQLLKLSAYRSIDYKTLKASFTKLTKKINANVENDFANYDHFSTRSFFSAYPKKLIAARFMSNHYHLIKEDVTHASLSDLEHFMEIYPLNKVLQGSAGKHVKSVYLDTLSRNQANQENSDLLENWNMLKQVESKGLDTEKLIRDKFLVMEIPSQSRLYEDAIDFPVNLDSDIDFKHRKTVIENAMIDNTFEKADYVIIVDTAASKAFIEENSVNDATSTYYTHSEYSKNPAFADAKEDVRQAKKRLRKARDNVQRSNKRPPNSSGETEALAKILGVLLSGAMNNDAVEEAQRNLRQAEQKLKNTPRQIEHKQYDSYNYQRLSTKGTKEYALNYFVIDKVSKKYVRGRINGTDSEFFTLVRNVRNDDPNSSEIKQNTVTDAELDQWRFAAINFKLSDIIADYKLRRKSADRLPAIALVQQDLFNQRNQSMLRLATTTSQSKKITLTQVGYGLNANYDFPKGTRSPNSIAIVVGVRYYENQDVPEVEFAHNDANAIKQFLIKTRGFSDENVIVLEDPRQSELLSYFGTETNYQGKLYDIVTRENMDNVFVYFSGHGIPTKAGSGVMLPSDADPLKPEFTGYKLETMIQNLNKLTNVETVLAVDSCFSGVSAGGTLIKDASPIFLSAQTNRLGLDNGVVFTAADGKEIASWDRDMRLGLFTRHFLEGYAGKADLNENGSIEVFEMEKHLITSVGRDANRRYSRQQTPQTVGLANKTLNKTIDPNLSSIDEIMRIAN